MLLFLPKNLAFLSIILGGFLLTLVGLLDDRKDIHPYIRLTTNALSALLVIISGTFIPYITNPLGQGVLDFHSITITLFGISIPIISYLVSFIWIYWTMNIIGWSAGVDGQLPGIVVISAIVLGILSLRFTITGGQELPTTILSFIVAGSFLGFLFWNFYPQKIMPGYSGKTLAGFLLAILGILSYAKLGTALIVLGVPMIDAIFTILRRLIKGRSPIWADRGHLHHYLLDLGWKKPTIALCYYIVSAILGAVALSVTSREKIFVLLVVSLGIGGFILWVHWVFKFSKQPDPDNG
jgi:UDP-GlcNAc:undecaprenyl-phosphate GlcNAc-1-phosphate transferase